MNANLLANPAQWVLAIVLIFSSLGVITARKPIYASLSFLLTLITLAVFYLQLSAQFIAVMQVLVYAGAILVIFVFVIVLFQDAYKKIVMFKPQSQPLFLFAAVVAFLATFGYLASQLVDLPLFGQALPPGFGTVQALGEALYLDFFFPFEAVTLLFLVALVGALYIAKKEE